MRKLKLDLDSLKVDTFAAERTPEPRGTVHGRYSSGPIACQYQCVSVGCTGFACPSEQCSGWECNSLSGCMSYENTCGCTADLC